MLLEGVFLPLTTPFHSDGALYLGKLQANVEHYSRTQAAGMMVLGDLSEADALDDAEAVAVLEAAIAATGREKVMVAEVARPGVRRTLALAAAAAAAGYDVLSVTADPAMAALEAEVFFKVVADRSPLPLVVRGVRGSLLRSLAEHENVLGAIVEDDFAAVVKLSPARQRDVIVTNIFAAVTRRMLADATPAGGLVSAASLGGGGGVATVGAAALKTRTKRVGFQVLAGGSRGILAGLTAGAMGALPALGACAPQACCEVYQAFRDGDPALAEEKQARVARAALVLEEAKLGIRFRGASEVARLKFGCDCNGYFGGPPRLPRLPLTAEERLAVQRALDGMPH
jgi:dihydrodipicolinate synthase/N-acetylneuraminate lyase